jgi:hypothetical protein
MLTRRNDTPLGNPTKVLTMPCTASWPGTGPEGARCGWCQFLTDKNTCSKYTALTGHAGKPIPASTAGCRYFSKATTGAAS